MRRQGRSLVWVATICTAVLGCGGTADEASPGDAGAAEAEASPADAVAEEGGEDAADAAVGFTVTVVETMQARDWWGGPLVAGPLEGATVAVDLPDGTRQEVTTDAEGQAWIPGPWESDERVTVVVYKENYSVFSWEAPVSKVTSRPLPVDSLAEVPLVLVSGNASGMTSKSNHLNVQAVPYLSISEKIGDSFAVYVAKDVPFSISASEWTECTPSCASCVCEIYFGWTRVDHPAVTEDSTVNLDFEQSLEPVFTTGTVELPSRPDSIFRKNSFLNVFVNSRSAPHTFGYSLTTDLSEDESTYSYTAEHVVWEGAEDVYTIYFDHGYDVPLSAVLVPGYPKEGAVISGFLDEVEMISPASSGTTVSILDRIEWEPREPTDAVFRLSRGGKMVWKALVDSSSSLRLPELPSTADPAELLGSAPLPSSLSLTAETDEANDYPERVIIMEPFLVTP